MALIQRNTRNRLFEDTSRYKLFGKVKYRTSDGAGKDIK